MGLPLDVVATDNDFVVRPIVPGLEPEDLNIEVTDDTISIKGEPKDTQKSTGEYLLDEIRYGKLPAAFRLASIWMAPKLRRMLRLAC